MEIPKVGKRIRTSLERHGYSLQGQPDPRTGEATVHVVRENGQQTSYVGHVDHYLGVWHAFAVVRPAAVYPEDAFGQFASFEEALLSVLVNFTHVA